jgi:hypothetical protein
MNILNFRAAECRLMEHQESAVQMISLRSLVKHSFLEALFSLRNLLRSPVLVILSQNQLFNHFHNQLHLLSHSHR